MISCDFNTMLCMQHHVTTIVVKRGRFGFNRGEGRSAPAKKSQALVDLIKESGISGFGGSGWLQR